MPVSSVKLIVFKIVVVFGEILGTLLRIAPATIQDGFTRVMLSATKLPLVGRLASIVGYRAVRTIYRGSEERILSVTAELPDGQGKIICNVCDKTPSVLAFNRDYEPEIRSTLLRFQQAGSIAIDCGAHVGIHAIPLARSAKLTGGTVLCFEPFERTRSFLYENIKINDVNNAVKVYECALSNEDSESTFHINPWNDGGGGIVDTGLAADGSKTASLSSLKNNTLTFATRTRRLDDIVSEHLEDSPSDQPDVSIVKIDVEGAELSVLEGSKELIAGDLTRYHPAFLVEMSLDIGKAFEVFQLTGYICFDTVTQTIVEDSNSIQSGANMLFVHPDHPEFSRMPAA
jgi:FkbM family methyltransferase